MAHSFERKSLFRITFPLFGYAIVSVAVTFADSALLANYSQGLVAAVSLANQILGVAYDLSALMSVGALILISQHLGREEMSEARQVAVIAMVAGMAIGFVIASVNVLGAPFFAAWINTPADVLGDVLIYIYIIAAALIFHAFIMSAQATLTGFGLTLPILTIGLASNVVYLALEYALVYGAWGAPELGVYGAAWSTVIVRGGTIALLIWVMQRKLQLRVADIPPGFVRRAWGIVKLSVPSMAENLAYNLYQLAIVAMIAVLGTSAVLTRSFSLTLTQIIAIITLVISHGNQVLVGYHKGARETEAAFQRGQRTALITGGVAMVAALALYIFGEPLITLLTQDAAVIADVKSILLLQVLVTPLNTVNLILFNSLKACGDVVRPVAASLVLTFAVALPAAYVAVVVLELGVVGLWYVYILEEGLKALAMLVLWRGRHWRDIEIMEPAT